MAAYNMFVGYDSNNNPQFENFNLNYDSRQDARLQEAQNMSAWNQILYSNEYNSPANQVQRLQDAGLNPLYFLGGNAGTTPSASASMSMGHGTGMDSRLAQLQSAVDTAANTFLGGSSNLLQSQKQAQEYDIANKELKLRGKELGLEERRLNQDIRESGQRITESSSRVDKIAQEIVNLAKEADLTEAQTTVAKNNAAYIEQMTAESAERARTEKTQQVLNRANADKSSAEAKTINSLRDTQVEQAKATLKVTDQEAKNLVAEMEKIQAETDKEKAAKEYTELQNKLIQKYGDAEKVVSLINGMSQSWNNFWSGVHHGTSAASDVLDYTPAGTVKAAGKVAGKAVSKSATKGTGKSYQSSTSRNP